MAGPATCFGGKGVDHLGVERCGFAGREVMGQDDDRLAEVLQLFAALAEQPAQDAFFDVEEIGCAGRQQAAVEALQRFGMPPHDSADSVLGRIALVAH